MELGEAFWEYGEIQSPADGRKAFLTRTLTIDRGVQSEFGIR